MQCTICISSFIINRSRISITPCNSVFHYKCLNKWLNQNLNHPKYPNCNFDFSQLFAKKEKLDLNNNLIYNNQNENGNNALSRDANTEFNRNVRHQNTIFNTTTSGNNNINQINSHDDENGNNIRIYNGRIAN